MEKIDKRSGIAKVKFYDKTIKVMIVSFVIFFLSIFFIPTEYFDLDIVVYPWLLIMLAGIIAGGILTIGMLYNAYKGKHFFWFIVIIFLGTIFPIIFYMKTIRPKLLGEEEDDDEEEEDEEEEEE